MNKRRNYCAQLVNGALLKIQVELRSSHIVLLIAGLRHNVSSSRFTREEAGVNR